MPGPFNINVTAPAQRSSFQALNGTFVVDADYIFTKEVGRGAYGAVVAAKHRTSGAGCAIKKISSIDSKVRSCTTHPLEYPIANWLYRKS